MSHNPPVVIIASDHAGVELKRFLVDNLFPDKKYSFLDDGLVNSDIDDYPDFSQRAAHAVLSGQADFGIVICGTGVGVSISANRYTGVRAALCLNMDMAELSRLHNNANILALGSRLLSQKDALAIAKTFLDTPFTHEERHLRRIEKIDTLPHDDIK